MKTTICAAFLLAFLGSDASAQSFYVGASVGESALEYRHEYSFGNSEADLSWRIQGGWRFADSLSLEASYHDFGTGTAGVFCPEVCIPEIARIDARRTDAWSLRLAYRFGQDRWQPFAALGWIWSDSDIHTEFHSGYPIVPYSTRDDGYSAELGVRYLLGAGFALRGGYEWFDLDDGDGAFNLGAEYAF
jgi:opacity protein-like surface antigen